MHTLRLPLAVLACSALYLGFAPAAFAAGGTDNAFVSNSYLSGLAANDRLTDIASDGTIYSMVTTSEAGTSTHVYRSLDGGETWSVWGSLTEPGYTWWNQGYWGESLHVAEGNVDRVYLLLHYIAPNYTSQEARLAYATHGDAVPTWTIVTIHASPSESGALHPIMLTSDQDNYASYYLYAILQQTSSPTRDVWFTRSIDLGATWEAPYKITDSVENSVYWYPSLSYGYGGILHVAMTHTLYPPLVEQSSSGIVYRRAMSFGNHGIGDWQAPIAITPVAGGATNSDAVVAAAAATSDVLISYRDATSNAATVRRSNDLGATWPAAQGLDVGTGRYRVERIPGSGGFLLGGLRGDSHVVVRRSTAATPLAFGSEAIYTDVADTRTHGSADLLVDASRGDQVALSWGWDTGGSPYTGKRLFDAQWRGVPGYPNVKPGFPVALAAAAVSPPALANLDGDPDLEIVFGDAAGTIQVYKDDGTRLTGWPRSIGGLATDVPVAIGDVDDDGLNEVVAGNSVGVVYLFERDGSTVPGWPIDTGGGSRAFVGIATITRESRFDIVVCSGREVRAYGHVGRLRTAFADLPVPATRPPALADLDGNLHTDILVPTATALYRYAHPATSGRLLRDFAPKTISDAVTVGDTDGDGELELAVPTGQGDVYLVSPKGEDEEGWPFGDASLGPLTSVALASVVGNDRLELGFAGQNWTAHLRLPQNTAAPGWPRTTATGWYVLGMPIVDTIDGAAPDVVLAGRDQYAYGWTHLGAAVNGWPRNLGSQTNLPGASGDIDFDGQVEIAVASLSSLYVIEVQAELVRSNPVAYWPMYGNNPGRTQCQNCQVELVTNAPESSGLPARVSLQPAYPNPSQGQTALRFELPERAAVELVIFDARGRRVRNVLKQELPAGVHRANWDGHDQGGHLVARGEYFARLSVRGPRVNDVRTRSVMLTR